MKRILVVIPTYNEAETIRSAVDRLRGAVPEADVLVVDDNSPDGTGEIVDKLAGADDHVNVLHRPGKQGLGRAYVAGFGWGLAAGYDVLVEMDADGSHQPEQLPDLLGALDGADLVIGSRYVPGGNVVNWPLRREVLSRVANVYTRLALGAKLRDATGGFRAYRADTLRRIGYEDVASQGYCFQVDLAWRTLLAGLHVREVPITFVEREHGQSKMDSSVVTEALVQIARWGVRHRGRQLRSLVTGRRRP